MERAVRHKLVKLARDAQGSRPQRAEAEAGDLPDEALDGVRSAWDEVRALELQPTTSRRALAELMALCAEAAVQVGEMEVAGKAVESFFACAPTKSQFFCRALFVTAQITAAEAAAAEPEASVRKSLEAVRSVLDAVDICVDQAVRPEYDFLVYNASVHLWRVIRPLLRDGLRGNAIEGLSKVVGALETVQDANLMWRGQLSVALALSYDEEGDAAKAEAEIKRAQALFAEQKSRQEGDQTATEECAAPFTKVPTAELSRACEEADRVMVHISKQASLAAARAAKGNGDIAPMLQCIRSGVLASDPAAIEKELEEALALAVARDGPRVAFDIARVGQLAVRAGLAELAARCMKAAQEVPSEHKAALEVVLIELLRSEWLAECPPPAGKGDEAVNSSSSSSTARATGDARRKAEQLARRIEAMQTIEKALGSCVRLECPSLVEEASVLAWNVSLPLLQPNLRRHVQTCFQVAVGALEGIDSPMTRLRAHLHGELAKCEVDSDFLTKASAQVAKALQLDDGAAGKGADAVGAGLSKALRPLHSKLQLKSNPYYEPETRLETAILQIEQAKDAKDTMLRAAVLNRASVLLRGCVRRGPDASVPELSDLSLENSDQSDGSPGEREKQLILLWGEVARLAWEVHLEDKCLEASREVLRQADELLVPPEAPEAADEQPGPEDRLEVLRLCARTRLGLCELYAARVKAAEVQEGAPLVCNLGLRALGMRVPLFAHAPEDATGSANPDEQTGRPQNFTALEETCNVLWSASESGPVSPELEAWKRQVVEEARQALRVGRELGEAWIIENAVVYLWNFHLHVFNGPLRRFQFMVPNLLAALLEAHEALGTLDATARDEALYASICIAAAHGLEAFASIQQDERVKASPIDAEELAWPSIGATPEAKLTKAVEVCRLGMEACSLRLTKDLHAALHRLQRQRKASEPLPQEPLAAAFAVLELVRLPDEAVKPDEKMRFVQDAAAALLALPDGGDDDQAADPDASDLRLELLARVGREALDAGMLDQAEACAARALRGLAERGTDRQDAIAKSQWRMYSMAECTRGRLVSARAEALAHDKSTQDSLREEALRHLTAAGEYGMRAGLSRLVLDAARSLWNVAVHLLGSAGTRGVLFKPLEQILAQLAASKESTDMPLQVSLYLALFECHKDKEDWAGGSAAVERAFRVVPQSLQKRLWEAMVIFSSKLKKDVAAGLHRMKEGTPSLQAKAWATLARSASQQEDQMGAFLQALSLLEGSFERCEYLVEFAEWLHANHYSRDDVTQCLLAAADLILDVKVADEREQALEDASKQLSTPSGVSPSRAGSSHSVLSKRSRTSKTVKAQHERQLGDPCTDAPTRLNMGLSFKLVQIFAMLARSVSHSRIRHDMSLIAAEHVLSTWEVFILPHARALGQTGGKATQATGGKLPEMLEAATSAELAQHGAVQEALATAERLPLVLHYLLELGSLLEECAQHVLALASYALIEFICLATDEHAFCALGKLKLVRCLVTLNLTELASQHVRALDLGLDEAERRRFSVEVELLLHNKAAEGKASRPGPPPAPAQPSFLPQLESDLPPTKRKVLTKLKIREIWALMAAEMVALGYMGEAKRLLQEVRRHNEAFDDEENKVRSCLVEARVAVVEGKFEVALSVVIEGMQSLKACGGANALEWLHYLQALNECLHRLGRSYELRHVLYQATAVFRQKVNMQGILKDLDLEVAGSYVETMLAEQALEEVLQRCATGGSWKHQWTLCQGHLRNAQDRILIATKPNCASIATVDVLLAHCEMWLKVYKTGAMRMQDVAFSNLMQGLQRASRCSESMVQMVKAARMHMLGAAESQVSLPLERMLGDIHFMLGTVELLHASHVSPPKTLAEVRAETQRLSGMDVVDQWLRATAPTRRLSEGELQPTPSTRASVHLVSAQVHYEGVSALRASSLLACGRGLAHAAVDQAQDKLALEAAALLCRAREMAGTQGAHEIQLEASMELLQLSCKLEAVGSALEHLLWSQSCTARAWLAKLFEAEACDRRSKLSSFLRLKGHVAQQLAHPRPLLGEAAGSDGEGDEAVSPGPGKWPFAECERFLAGSTAWQRLQCEEGVESILRSAPSDMVFVVMHLSSDGRALFSSAFSKESRHEAKVHRYILGSQSEHGLARLRESVAMFRKRTASFLLGHEKRPCFDFQGGQHEDRIDEELVAIAEQVREILGPALGRALGRAVTWADEEGGSDGPAEEEGGAEELQDRPEGDPAPADGTEDGGDDAAKESESAMDLAGKCVMLLADPALAELPLEALFDEELVQSVSRDFSLHMFAHRLRKVAKVGAADGGDDDREPELLPRPGAVSLVVDPRAEDEAVLARMKEATSGTAALVSGAEDGIPSQGVWQKLLGEAKGGGDMQFMYVGFGPLLTHALPTSLAQADLSQCWSAVLVDRCFNDLAFRNNNKRESSQSLAQLRLERPLETCAVLSLCGVNAVALNQWSNSVRANLVLAEQLLAALEDGKRAESLSETVWSFLREPRETAQPVAAESDPSREAGAGAACEDSSQRSFKARVRLNTMVYGVPQL